MKLTPALLLALLFAAPALAQVAFFDEPTDVIQVDGQTVIGAASTYEAVVLFPSGTGAGGMLFNEWTGFQEDKVLRAGPTFLTGYNWPAGSTLHAGAALVPDAWHHVAFVYDGAEERLYLDGALVAARPASVSVGDGSGLAHVGAIFRDGQVNPSFVGYMESIRISDIARYEGDGFEPTLGDLDADANVLLLLNFDEPAGSETVQDGGPLGRTGTLGVGFDGATPPELGAIPPTAECPLASSTADLWDITRETVVTASTGFRSGSDEEGENIFGGTFPTNEAGVAFFRDDQADGFVHAVEWETAADVAVRSFVLRAAHDEGLLRRSFRTFRLFGFDADAGAFELLYEFDPPLPYEGGEGNLLTACANLPERTTGRFRAEFVQNGAGAFHGPRVIELDAFSTPIVFAVSGESPAGGSSPFALHAAYPNPFRGRAVVAYDLEQASALRLAVYDVLGREVAVLVEGEQGAGRHEAVFEGAGLVSGVYLVRLTTGASSATRTLTLLR